MSTLRSIFKNAKYGQPLSFINSQKQIDVTIRLYSNQKDNNILISKYKTIFVENIPAIEKVFQNVNKWHNKIAIECAATKRSYTYEQLRKSSRTFAASLRTKFKLKSGDVIAVMLPNMPEFPVVTLGILYAGLVATTVNPIYKNHELQHQLKLTEASAIVTTSHCYNVITDTLNSMKKSIPIIIIDEANRPVPDGTIKYSEFAHNSSIDLSCLKSIEYNMQDLCFLPFSSGTTGLAKGVALTNKQITSAMSIVNSPEIHLNLETTESHQDVIPAVLPFFHIYGLAIIMMSHLYSGCKIITMPGFNPELFLNVLKNDKSTLLFLVPPVGSNEVVRNEHLQHLRYTISGAAPLSLNDAQCFMTKSNGKMQFIQAFGMTETCGLGLSIDKGATNYGAVGSPLPNIESKIVSIEDGRTLGPNEEGELCIRGPIVMEGYYKNPKATEETFTDGPWLRTGDMAYYDSNKQIYITDRLKELIKVKGFQVAPAELEGLLRSHPQIEDAAVVGIPHNLFGEVPKAFIVPKDEDKLDIDSIKEFVSSKVASYKNIEEIALISEVPRNPSGKILRRQLK